MIVSALDFYVDFRINLSTSGVGNETQNFDQDVTGLQNHLKVLQP